MDKKLKKLFGYLYFTLFINIFFPKRCIICGKYGLFLCGKCVKNVVIFRTPVCFYCGKITKYGESCSSCKKIHNSSLDGIIYSSSFNEGNTKEIIHYLKYNGIIELSTILSAIVLERIKNKLPKGKIVVVPVPMFIKKERSRGFNQSELIAREVSMFLGLHGGLGLKKVRSTSSQAESSRETRMKNIKNSFVCDDVELIKDKTVLLIDDIVTTGSTLEECAQTLKNSGAKRVYGVVIASAKY